MLRPCLAVAALSLSDRRHPKAACGKPARPVRAVFSERDRAVRSVGRRADAAREAAGCQQPTHWRAQADRRAPKAVDRDARRLLRDLRRAWIRAPARGSSPGCGAERRRRLGAEPARPLLCLPPPRAAMRRGLWPLGEKAGAAMPAVPHST